MTTVVLSNDAQHSQVHHKPWLGSHLKTSTKEAISSDDELREQEHVRHHAQKGDTQVALYRL